MTALRPLALALSLAAAGVAGTASAQNVKGPVKARQGEMQLIATNLGILGGMAKGSVAYDSEVAAKAAADLVAISSLSQEPIWVEGSDNASFEASGALPAVWEDWDGFMEKWDAFGAGAATMAAAAGTSQEALGGAMGAIGGTCKGCHETFRAK